MTTASNCCEFLLSSARASKKLEIIREMLSEYENFEPFSIFLSLDRSHKGYIDSEDLYSFLKINDFSGTIEEIEQGFLSNFDMDKDKRLCYGEFLRAMLPNDQPALRTIVSQRPIQEDIQINDEIEYTLAKLIKEEIQSELSLEPFRNIIKKENEILFNIISKNQGFIDFYSLLDFFKNNGFYPYEEEIIGILRRFDRDDNGRIEKNEWDLALKIDFSRKSINQITPTKDKSKTINDKSTEKTIHIQSQYGLESIRRSCSPMKDDLYISKNSKISKNTPNKEKKPNKIISESGKTVEKMLLVSNLEEKSNSEKRNVKISQKNDERFIKNDEQMKEKLKFEENKPKARKTEFFMNKEEKIDSRLARKTAPNLKFNGNELQNQEKINEKPEIVSSMEEKQRNSLKNNELNNKYYENYQQIEKTNEIKKKSSSNINYNYKPKNLQNNDEIIIEKPEILSSIEEKQTKFNEDNLNELKAKYFEKDKDRKLVRHSDFTEYKNEKTQLPRKTAPNLGYKADFLEENEIKSDKDEEIEKPHIEDYSEIKETEGKNEQKFKEKQNYSEIFERNKEENKIRHSDFGYYSYEKKSFDYQTKMPRKTAPNLENNLNILEENDEKEEKNDEVPNSLPENNKKKDLKFDSNTIKSRHSDSGTYLYSKPIESQINQYPRKTVQVLTTSQINENKSKDIEKKENNNDLKLIISYFKSLYNSEYELDRIKENLALRPDFNLVDLFSFFDDKKEGNICEEQLINGLNLLEIKLEENDNILIMAKISHLNTSIRFVDFCSIFEPFSNDYLDLLEMRKSINNDFHFKYKELFSRETRRLITLLLNNLLENERKLELERQALKRHSIDLEKIYNEINTNKNGLICYGDLKNIITINENKLSDRDINLIMRRIDWNKDGFIDLDEFCYEFEARFKENTN